MVSRRSLETATAILTGAFGAAVVVSSLDNGIGWSSAAVGTALALYLIFELTFQISLPRGLLGEALGF